MSPSLSQFAESNDEIVSLREANIRLQAQLREAKARNERLVDAVQLAAYDAMVSLGGVPIPAGPPKDLRKKSAEVALIHMTDWQGAKKTASYNSDVMRDRVMRFVAKSSRIVEIHRADHPVKEAHILFGGDMIEGLFNFPTQPFEIDQTIFGQYVTVSRLIVDVILNYLTVFEKVTVTAEWGNHGRMGSKRSVVPKSDNLDRMTYELSRQLLQDDSRVVWAENGPEDIQRVEIGNYRALLIHGDEIGRNGYASPSTIVGHANDWASGAYDWAFRDVYVGHYHNHSSWAMANGRGTVYQTGSIESDNRYARDTMAASAIPSQRLHFVEPVKGFVTAEYKILLHE